MSDETIYSRTYAKIDLDAIKENINNIKSNLDKKTKVCAVIKADAYGHGAVPVAKTIEDDVDFFAVATFDEASNLRNHDINKPILILGYIHTDYTMYSVRNGFRLTVFDVETAKRINEFAKDLGEGPAKVHIKIDTGMSRIGFSPCQESYRDIEKICNMDFIDVEGIYTHFSKADCEDTEEFDRQFALFKKVCDDLEAKDIHFKIKHCSNSAAATVFRRANMDMVRLGISIYGLYPSECVHQVALKGAMSLFSHISFIRQTNIENIPGCTTGHNARGDMRIAAVDTGYADGYKRSLSNKGYVLVKGKRADIIGNIDMDHFMIDITDIPGVNVGDEVVLVGKSNDENITMEEISELAGSFNYEFACDISKRVPRIYYADGVEVCHKDYFYDKYIPINKHAGMVHAH